MMWYVVFADIIKYVYPSSTGRHIETYQMNLSISYLTNRPHIPSGKLLESLSSYRNCLNCVLSMGNRSIHSLDSLIIKLKGDGYSKVVQRTLLSFLMVQIYTQKLPCFFS